MQTESQHSSTENKFQRLDPLQDGISSLELIRISGSDIDVVNAARVSFGKTSIEMTERDEKLIAYLLKHKHTSPFEHNQLSFRIKCPLIVSRQWMRHRMNSYNEVSQRYVKVSLEFFIPQTWRHQSATNKQSSHGAFASKKLEKKYRASIELAAQTYEELLDAGVAREIARSVLPTCTYTEFIFTCNLHSLMHFLNLRLTEGAQYEIRMYAQGLLKLAKPHFPITLAEWEKLRNS